MVFSNVRTYLSQRCSDQWHLRASRRLYGLYGASTHRRCLTDFLFRYVASDGVSRANHLARQVRNTRPLPTASCRSQPIPFRRYMSGAGSPPGSDGIDAHRASITDRVATARAIIDRLRTAVLAAACSGRLTADWRVGDRGPASQDGEVASDRAIDLALPDLPATPTR